MSEHMLIAGCGYLGAALAKRLAAAGDPDRQIWGLRRQVNRLPQGVQPIAADLTSRGLARKLPAVRFDQVYLCAAAAGPTQEAYEALYVEATAQLLAALRAAGPPPQQVLFVSSTAVYAQNDGEEVDETSPTSAAHFRGRCMLQAERLVQDSGLPSQVLRLGGLYGPGRRRLLDQVAQGQVRWPHTTHFTNRIHRDDAAAALVHLAQSPPAIGSPTIFLGVDRLAADQLSILRFAHQLLQRPLPANLPTPEGHSGKRCSSARLQSQGFRFAYPTYQEGLRSLL